MGDFYQKSNKSHSKVFVLPDFAVLPSSQRPLNGSSFLPPMLQADEAALIAINRVDAQILRQTLYFFPLIKVKLEGHCSISFGQVASHDEEIDEIQEMRDFGSNVTGEITPPILHKLPMPRIAPTEPIENFISDIDTYFVADFSRIIKQIASLDALLRSRIKSSVNLALISAIDATNEQIENMVNELSIDIKSALTIEYYPYFVFFFDDSQICAVNAVSGIAVSGVPHNDGSSFIKEAYEAERYAFELQFFTASNEESNAEDETDADFGVDESILTRDKDATIIIIDESMAKESLDEQEDTQQQSYSTKAFKQTQSSNYEPEDDIFSPLEKQEKSLRLLRKNALSSVPLMVVTLLVAIFLVNVPFSISIPLLLLSCGAIFALDHFKFDGEIRVPIFVLLCAMLATYILLSILCKNYIIDFAMDRFAVDPALHEQMLKSAKIDFDILVALFLLQTLLILVFLIRRNHKTMVYEHSIFNRQIYSILFLSTLSSLIALMIANNIGLLFVNDHPLRAIYMLLTLLISFVITVALAYIWKHLPSQKLRLPSTRKH